MRYVLHLSAQITRRKYAHYVTDPDDQVLYTTRDAKDVWRWLYEREAKEVLIAMPDGSLEVTIGQLLPW